MIDRWLQILPWRQQRGWVQGDQERSHSTSHLVPDPALWREPPLCLSSAMLTRTPAKTAAGTLLHKETNWIHENMEGGGGITSDRRSRSFPAVSALGGQWIVLHSRIKWRETSKKYGAYNGALQLRYSRDWARFKAHRLQQSIIWQSRQASLVQKWLKLWHFGF